MIDWVHLLSSRGIEFVDQGPNVAKGNINIQCPFCGRADSSHHMGIRLSDGYWGCWRDKAHRGRRPHRLLKQLLGMSGADVDAMLSGESMPIDVDLDALADELEVGDPGPGSNTLELPEDLSMFSSRPGAAEKRFCSYLRRRGFSQPYRVARYYDLRWSVAGDMAYRLVIPFYMDGVCVGYTGRSVGNATVRYDSRPKGQGALSGVLANYDHARKGGKHLVIVEGPFDALKVDWYGRKRGIRAVPLLGLSNTARKATALSRIVGRFESAHLLLDSGAESNLLDMSSALTSLGVRILEMPRGVEDPGDLSKQQVRQLF